MAASRYRKFVRLAENWPVDKSKSGRDLGVHLREKIAAVFQEGPNTKINERECDRQYEALQKLSTDYYRQKFPRVKETSATGSTAEECNRVMSTEGIKEMEYLDRTTVQKVKDYFRPSKDASKR